MVYCMPRLLSPQQGKCRVRRRSRVAKIRGLIVACCFILSALAISGCVRRPQHETLLEIGQPAPAFRLQDINGQEVTLDQFKGRVVMLDFWATWCGPCRMTMPLLEGLAKEYASTMVLLAINLQDPKEVVKEYIWKQGIHSQVLLDEDGSVGALYGAESIPMEVLIDKEGIVRHVQMGFGPNTLSQFRAEIERLR